MMVEKNANPKIVKVMQNIIYDAFPSDMSIIWNNRSKNMTSFHMTHSSKLIGTYYLQLPGTMSPNPTVVIVIKQ